MRAVSARPSRLASLKVNEMAECSECRVWCGRCLKEKLNRTASSDACEMFDPTPQEYEFRVLFPRLLVNQKSQKKVGGEVNG